MSLHFQLNLQEVNQVLHALGEQPYAQVHKLIDKIRAQADPQLQPPAEPSHAHAPSTEQVDARPDN